jgi:hypothetical protein
MKTGRRRFCFLKNVSNPNWNRRPGIIECLSLRLRISLLKKIVSAKIPKRNNNGEEG